MKKKYPKIYQATASHFEDVSITLYDLTQITECLSVAHNNHEETS